MYLDLGANRGVGRAVLTGKDRPPNYLTEFVQTLRDESLAAINRLD
jgi:hypothetical protein